MSTFPSQKRFPKRSVFPLIPPAAQGRGATCSQTARKEEHLPGERRTPSERRLIASLLQKTCPGRTAGPRRRPSPCPPPGRTPSRTAPGRNAESRSRGCGTGAAGLPLTPVRPDTEPGEGPCGGGAPRQPRRGAHTHLKVRTQRGR